MLDEQEIDNAKELTLEDLEEVAGGSAGTETDLIESPDGTKAYGVKSTEMQEA